MFSWINQAFVELYPESGDGLDSKSFTSQSDAEDYVKARDYSKDALCFTLGWQTYVNTDAEK